MATLTGYKTYISAAAIAAVTVLHYLEIIDGELAGVLLGLLGAGGLAALRAGVAKGKSEP